MTNAEELEARRQAAMDQAAELVMKKIHRGHRGGWSDPRS